MTSTTGSPPARNVMDAAGETVRLVAAGAGVVAPIVFVLAIAVGGAGASGFSQWTSFISELGQTGAPTATFVNTAFVIVGALLLVFAAGVGLGIGAPGSGRVAALLVVPGVAFVVMAISPCSAGCPIALVNLSATTSDAVHNAAATAGLVAIALAALLLGERAPDGFGADGYASFSGAAGAAIGTLSAAFGLAVLSGSRPAIAVSERVLVLAALVWIEVTALALARWNGRAQPGEGAGQRL
jgi:hypothetical membrane protein